MSETTTVVPEATHVGRYVVDEERGDMWWVCDDDCPHDAEGS